MKEYLQDTLAKNAMPRKRYIHDCVDAGTDFALVDGVPVLFPCDCSLRNYSVDGKEIWDNTEHTLKDSIDNSVVFAEFSCIVNGAVNTVIEFYFYIDHPTLGIIPVKTKRKRVTKQNIDDPLDFVTMLYDATDSDAKMYGFKVSIEAQGGDVTLKARSVLSVTG